MATTKQAAKVLTREEALLARDRLFIKIAKMQKEAESLRRIGASKCKHERTRSYRWEHDTGYGVQTWHDGTMCLICHQVSPYNNGYFHPQYSGD